MQELTEKNYYDSKKFWLAMKINVFDNFWVFTTGKSDSDGDSDISISKHENRGPGRLLKISELCASFFKKGICASFFQFSARISAKNLE